jgi:hypothetical protein
VKQSVTEYICDLWRTERLPFPHIIFSIKISTLLTLKHHHTNNTQDYSHLHSITSDTHTRENLPFVASNTMSYLHLHSTRTRERSPSPPLRSIIRRDTKRSRFITLSDDEDDGHDDYPYSTGHRPVKTSRALTIRDQPGQLERYNIWSDRHKSEDRDEDKAHERSLSIPRRSDDCDREEQDFRLKLAAKFSRPTSSHHHHHHEARVWPGDMFRRKEKWVDEGWETRERSRSRSRSREIVGRRDSFWGDGGFWGEREQARESDDERVTRYRKIKRTKTEEWTPLRGWRRV